MTRLAKTFRIQAIDANAVKTTEDAIAFLCNLTEVLGRQHQRIRDELIAAELLAFTPRDMSGATPNVSVASVYKTNNSASTNVTDFTNAREGQRILLIGNDGGKTTIKHNAAKINLAGGIDCTLADGDTIELVYDGTDFDEINRADNTP